MKKLILFLLISIWGVLSFIGCDFSEGTFTYEINSNTSYNGSIEVLSGNNVVLYQEDINNTGNSEYKLDVFPDTWYIFNVITDECNLTNYTNTNLYHSSSSTSLQTGKVLSCGEISHTLKNGHPLDSAGESEL